MKDGIDSIISKVELSTGIARIALGCPTCRGQIKELILNHNSFSISNSNSKLHATSNQLTGALPDHKKKVNDLNVDVVSKHKWLSEVDPSDNQMHEERSHDISIKR